MKSIAALLTVAALGFCGLVTRAEAQDTKWVRGKVTAVAADSVTVTVRGKEMKFTVDKDSKLIATGAGTATRKEGGVVITNFVKVGDGAEVKYHDMGATLHAAEIRQITDPGEGSSSEDKPAKEPKPKTSTASGTVTAVSPTSLTVKGDSAEWTFTVDAKTSVVGPGVGTKGREVKEATGKGATITDLVGKNDVVTVTYHDMGATKHAADVRITRRALK